MSPGYGETWPVNLIDTSVWIALLRGHDTAATRLLRRWLLRGVTCIAPVILQELLQGARGEKELIRLETHFGELPMLEATKKAHAAAGALYARLRWQGVTVRSPHDCLITAVAVEHDVPLLTLDRDFRAIVAIEPALRLVEAPLK